MAWYGIIRYGMVWYGSMWYHVVPRGTMWYHMVPHSSYPTQVYLCIPLPMVSLRGPCAG